MDESSVSITSSCENDSFRMSSLDGALKDAELADIPNALIFTNLPHSIFDRSEDNPIKAEFERTLQTFDNSIKIAYLPNFCRARVEFSSGIIAAHAKLELHMSPLDSRQIKAYFVQIPTLYDAPEKSQLNPPKPQKQFLISPPASPPVGWEPITEHEPVVNYELVNAMLSLGPEGGPHELHSGCTESNIPKIVVHLTPEQTLSNGRTPIVQTRRPPERNL